MWGNDRRELYFISGANMMAADVIPGPTFQFRSPHALFPVRLAQSEAWLLTAARHSIIDLIRHQRVVSESRLCVHRRACSMSRKDLPNHCK
jgi:hypothetical protein